MVYAETIKRNLERFGIRTFVAHLEKRKYSGNFRDKIDGAISKCKYFILLVTIDTLDRIEVIRETRVAYSNHLTIHPKLIIFREDLEEVPRRYSDFAEKTGINLSKENQHDFRTTSELASSIISLCRYSDIIIRKEEPSHQQPLNSDTIRPEQRRPDFIPAAQKEEIYHQLTEIFTFPFWKYLEYKVFMFRETGDGPWMIQFAFLRLVENKPMILEGKSTEHMRLVHGVVEIQELNRIVDQIVSGQRLLIHQSNGSLALVPGRIMIDFFYKSHPMTELFTVSAPSYQLLKPGHNNSELSRIENILISELEGEFAASEISSRSPPCMISAFSMFLSLCFESRGGISSRSNL